MSPQLIALTGYAGAGKSTVARHLVDRHRFTLVRFAGPLKAMMRCLGLSDREIEGDLKQQPHQLLCGKSPRHAMQTIGTEWGRDMIGQNLWVNVAMASAWQVMEQGGRVVIDDCRFPNEAAAIKAAGGVILRIQRPGVGPLNAHPSEVQTLPIDGVIENCGSVDDLMFWADRAFASAARGASSKAQ